MPQKAPERPGLWAYERASPAIGSSVVIAPNTCMFGVAPLVAMYSRPHHVNCGC